MKYIKTFESLVGNKFYFNTEFDIKSLTFKEISQEIRFEKLGSGWKNIEENSLIIVYKDIFDNYKKRTGNIISYSSNYIWQINKSLNLFKYDNYHLDKLISILPIFIEYAKHWFSIQSDDINEIKKIVLEKSKEKDSRNFYNLSGHLLRFEPDDMKIFKNNWDGVLVELDRETQYYVFWDIAKDAQLVGGNEKRFGIKSETETFDMPEWVLDELIRYTNDASKKMNLEVKEWLKKNSPKPSTNTQIYRSFGIELHDWSKYDKTSDAIINEPLKLSKYLYRLTGLKKLEDFKKGEFVNVKRGKESSWSHTALISRQFARGLASGSINLLVKYDVSPDEIVIDFTQLPESLKKKFKFRNQNEVILDTGAYKAEIADIWLDEGMIAWLNENGYTWIPKKGIFKN